MKTLQRITTILLISAVVILSIVLTPIQSVHAAESLGISKAYLALTDLGGLDLNRYCSQKYYYSIPNGRRTAYAQLQNSSPYAWVCVVQTDTYEPAQSRRQFLGMNLNEACVWQKGSGAYAGLTGNKGPYDWHCFR